MACLNVTYGLRVTHCAVRTILHVVDPEGVRRRTAHRFRRRAYHGHGPNGVIHIDGYDKLKPFGIAIHGSICGNSRKILWLQACPSNDDPGRVAHYFIDYLRDINGVPRLIRTDAGTENVEVQVIQIALRLGHNDDMSGFRSVGIGCSTANQRIEILWAILRCTVTQYWRNMFISLVNDNLLNNIDPIHLECIRLCFCLWFNATWTYSRTRGIITECDQTELMGFWLEFQTICTTCHFWMEQFIMHIPFLAPLTNSIKSKIPEQKPCHSEDVPRSSWL